MITIAGRKHCKYAVKLLLHLGNTSKIVNPGYKMEGICTRPDVRSGCPNSFWPGFGLQKDALFPISDTSRVNLSQVI
jgi:hypothetical protein